MSESFPSQIEKPRSELPIEQQANFEGSWTNLMCERMENPEIQKQIIDLLCEEAQNSVGDVVDFHVEKTRMENLKRKAKRSEKLEESGTKYIENHKQRSRLMKDLKWKLKRMEKVKMSGTKWMKDKTKFVDEYGTPKTNEQIEEEFEEKLKKILNDTPISFGTTMPNANGSVDEKDRFDADRKYIYDRRREVLNLNYIFSKTGKKPTEHQWNIVESHEKGHVIREYNRRTDGQSLEASGPYCLEEKFYKAFDFSVVRMSEQDCDRFRESVKEMGSIKESKKTNEELLELTIEYLKSPSELAERMSQLKNYFGLSGTNQFTKEHLTYTREHFITDTGFDNSMTQFFQAITPEKEDAFIELINSAGI